MKKKKIGSYKEPERLVYPEDEIKIAWLAMLLDAYFTADQGIHESILKELNKKRNLACAKGCSSCCKTHVTIPVYPLELLGLYWYVLKKSDDQARELIIRQLMEFEPGKGCPFLTNGFCGIHPMRPLACRFFNVFTKPCGEGEDPYYSRRQDLLIPDEKLKDKALSLMLPYHGITQRTEKKEAMRNGLLLRYVKNLQEINWPKVAMRLSQGDSSFMMAS